MWSPKYTHERPSFLCDRSLKREGFFFLYFFTSFFVGKRVSLHNAPIETQGFFPFWAEMGSTKLFFWPLRTSFSHAKRGKERKPVEFFFCLGDVSSWEKGQNGGLLSRISPRARKQKRGAETIFGSPHFSPHPFWQKCEIRKKQNDSNFQIQCTKICN